MPPPTLSRKQLLAFIDEAVAELGPSPAAEEEIVYRLVQRFGRPHGGNTDWWRHTIRRAQGGRPKLRRVPLDA